MYQVASKPWEVQALISCCFRFRLLFYVALCPSLLFYAMVFSYYTLFICYYLPLSFVSCYNLPMLHYFFIQHIAHVTIYLKWGHVYFMNITFGLTFIFDTWMTWITSNEKVPNNSVFNWVFSFTLTHFLRLASCFFKLVFVYKPILKCLHLLKHAS